MRTYARAWLLVALLIGGIGVLEALLAVSGDTAWWAVVVAGGTGGLGCLAHHTLVRSGLPVVRWKVARGVAVGGIGGAALAGLGALLGWLAVLLVVLVVLTAPAVLLGVATRAERVLIRLRGVGSPAPQLAPQLAPPAASPPVRRSLAAAATPPPAATPSVVDWPDANAVRALSTAGLCWGWRTSFTALHRLDLGAELGQRAALVLVRQCYLDEMARRDPAGVARWLYAGARPASDPSRYLASAPVSRSAAAAADPTEVLAERPDASA